MQQQPVMMVAAPQPQVNVNIAAAEKDTHCPTCNKMQDVFMSEGTNWTFWYIFIFLLIVVPPYCCLATTCAKPTKPVRTCKGCNTPL